MRAGRRVTLVDLDVVEPFFTLRPIKGELEARGLRVVTGERHTLGLGETGVPLAAEARWALRREGDVILDVGYGAYGAQTLNLVEGAGRDPDLVVLAVVNVARPMTATVEDVVAHVRELGRVDGLINNTHLGEDTTVELVQEGARVVTAAARALGLPVVATSVVRELAPLFGGRDVMGNPVRALERFMPRAFW